VRRNLGKILTDSHISAVAIAVLLLWSISYGSLALSYLLVLAGEFLFSLASDVSTWWRDGLMPPSGGMLFDRGLFVMALEYLFRTLGVFGATWIVSRFIYGAGPLRSLSQHRARVARRDYV
jgi:hypothetical protein